MEEEQTLEKVPAVVQYVAIKSLIQLGEARASFRGKILLIAHLNTIEHWQRNLSDLGIIRILKGQAKQTRCA